MKTIEINLYKFAELSAEAKNKAVEKLWDINVDHNWWEYTFEDAKQIGLIIEAFNIDHGTIKANFDDGAEQTAPLIMANHGAGTYTYQLASNYWADRNRLIENSPKDEHGQFVDEYEVDGDLDQLDHDFLVDLKGEYLDLLRKDYEYNTDKENIIATIEANDYDFTEDGELY